MNALPKITVVTPNYNGADLLEQTLDSVLSQGYPALEYIVVDGGSTDRSMDIVRRHERHLARVICGPDTGHANALNKGFQSATGEVMAWINSDDLLLPGSLACAGEIFRQLPQVEWLTGQRNTLTEDGAHRPPQPLKRWSWVRFVCGDFRHIQQESTFWRRDLWQRTGAHLDERLALANDFELWLRFFRTALLHTVDEPLGSFRTRSGQRSAVQYAEYERECEQAMQVFVRDLPPALLARYADLIPGEQLVSRAQRPRQLPEDRLAALDPPQVRFDRATALARLDTGQTVAPPATFAPDSETVEDLQFDGLDRAIWTEGPDFAVDELLAVGLEIVPFVPKAPVPPGMSDETPPMPALIGPLALSDWGNGRIQVHVRGAAGKPVDLSLPDLGRSYRLAWLRVGARSTLLLDGVAVAEQELSATLPPAHRRVVLGGGFARRFWLGSLDSVSITTQPLRGGAPTTRHLTHTEGVQRLPREVRTGLVPLPPRPIAEAIRPSSLSAWRNRHQGQRCFVMGNGPSLNRTDLSRLDGEIVFACNAAFLLFERVQWRPTYYACVDTRVIRDRADDISAMLDAHPDITAFFPSELPLHDGSGVRMAGREVIKPGPNRHYFHEIGNRETHHPETMFSLDADDHVVQPYTVAITMLQLAVYMGFSEIYLIGCDTSYKVGSTVRQEGREIDGTGLLLTSTADDDANHFDPRYFGRGREWHNPQVAQMLNHYRWARLAARRVGARIRNATVGGQLEVFERVDFDSLFPARTPSARTPLPPRSPLLSIAIPAYGRPATLLQALQSFASQIDGRFEDEVEVVVSDDCTPDDGLREVRAFAASRRYMRWRRYDQNIGLERNLLACSDICTGEYLWIFGDDDFLEADDALATVVGVLREGRHDMLVLNRSRRSADLSRLLTPNWMGLEESLRRDFDGLRDFCLAFGYLSVVGFISVNVFRRRQFRRVDAQRYMGTMYPQLGAMVEAFHDRPLLLLGRPLVCHRTQTPEEKRAALGKKAAEADFMADMHRRNAVYFSHPHIAMLDDLLDRGAFSPENVLRIRENTVIDGLLIDFLIDCIRLNARLAPDDAGAGTDAQWRRSVAFFDRLPLDKARRQRIDTLVAPHRPAPRRLSVSVVTPSFNQAEFLPDCLRTIGGQTHAAIEHLVYDPGSDDGSREIAAGYPHVTLMAEPDEGQSDAVNKGMARARGDIICWLNSDDQLADPEVFARVIDRFEQPDEPDIVYGRGFYIDEAGSKLRDAYINHRPETLAWRFAQEDGILQPALFMRRSVIERVGPLRNDLHFSMDYEYWIRCVKNGIRFAFIDSDLAIARYHISNKTYGQRGKSYAEVCRMVGEHFGYVSHHWLRRYAEFLTEGHDGVLAHSHNKGVKNTEALEESYRQLLVEQNGTASAQQALRRGAGRPGAGETLAEMQGLGLASGHDPVDPKAAPVGIEGAATAMKMSAGPAPSIFAGAAYTRINRSEWIYRQCPLASDRQWQCVFLGGPPGLRIATLSLVSSADLRVRLSLCRHGDSPWEGRTTEVHLLAGQRCRHALDFRFQHAHKGLRLQIEVLEGLVDDKALLRVNGAHLAEVDEPAAAPGPGRDAGGPSMPGVLQGAALQARPTPGVWAVRGGGRASDRIWARLWRQLPAASYQGLLRLKATRGVAVRVTLGRHGATEWEGTGRTIHLQADTTAAVMLRVAFGRSHEALKLQFEVLDDPGTDGLEIEVVSAGLAETLDSLRQRLLPASRSLVIAHGLTDQGVGSTSLGMCLLLRQRHGAALLDASVREAAALAGLAGEGGPDHWMALLS